MKFLLLLQNVSHGNESVQLRLGSTLGSLALRTPDQQVSVIKCCFVARYVCVHLLAVPLLPVL